MGLEKKDLPAEIVRLSTWNHFFFPSSKAPSIYAQLREKIWTSCFDVWSEHSIYALSKYRIKKQKSSSRRENLFMFSCRGDRSFQTLRWGKPARLKKKGFFFFCCRAAEMICSDAENTLHVSHNESYNNKGIFKRERELYIKTEELDQYISWSINWAKL